MTLKELKEKLYYSVPELDGEDFDDILEQIIYLQREKELSGFTDEQIKTIIQQERDKNPVFNKYQLSFQVAKRIIKQGK